VNIVSIIMSGGYGSRLWPLSTCSSPKQFNKSLFGSSLFQQTLFRNRFLDKHIVVTNIEQLNVAQKQISDLEIDAHFIVEPYPRNTTAATIAATIKAKQLGFNTAIILPADHHIANDVEYVNTLKQCCLKSSDVEIMAIGIKPLFASTQYGYINVPTQAVDGLFKVKDFVEKPTIEKAEIYFANQDYFWNSGIFIYNVDFMLSKFKELVPKIYASVEQGVNSADIGVPYTAIDDIYYENIPSISLDYSIITKLSEMFMIEGKFPWIDLGNWDSLCKMSKKDLNNNYLSGNVIAKNTINSHIESNAGKLVVTVGIDNMLIINESDVILIADKSKII